MTGSAFSESETADAAVRLLSMDPTDEPPNFITRMGSDYYLR